MTELVRHVGAAKSVADATLATLLTRLREAVASAVSEGILAAHNAYATYVFVVLLITTGHRPVADAIESIDLIDERRRLVVVCDKVVRHAYESRLVTLCDTAATLLSRYRDHLYRLAQALWDSEPDLAENIRAAAQLGPCKPLPLFFYFDEHGVARGITPKLLRTAVPELDQLEPNIGRSWIASLGLAPDVDADLIRAALGHHEMGTDVFGSHSPRCPSDLAALGASIDARMASMGVSALASPLPPLVGRAPTLPIGLPHATLGMARRASAQREQAAAARQLHRQSLADCMARARKGPLTQADVDSVFAAICGAAGAPLTRIQVEAYSRAWDVLGWLLARKGWPLRLPPRYRPLATAMAATWTAPFLTPATLALAQECDALTDAFDQYLRKRGAAAANGHVSYAVRAAEAMISLALHSRVADPVLLDRVGRSEGVELSAVRGIGGFAQLDLSADRGDGPMMVRRVVLHPVTLALLQSLRHLPPPTVHSSVADQSVRLASALGRVVRLRMPATYLTDLVQEHSEPPRSLGGVHRWICSRVAALNAVSLPGVVASHLDGSARTVGLRPGHFARVVTGLPLVVTADAPPKDKKSKELTVALQAGRAFAVDPPLPAAERTAPREELRRFHALARAINKVLSRHTRLGERKDGSNALAKDDLIAKLESALKSNADAPPEARMGVQFLTWMLESFRGGDGGERPQHHISTSIRYYYAVMPRIPLAMLEARCHGQGADALADVYGTALEAVAPRGQAYVFARLQLFHAAMQVDYGLPDIDWADVVPLTMVGTCSVDAGVVTYEEYHAALEALLADSQADERTRSLQAWVLLVMYRFGLRISEALGLRRKDLWPDAELPVVLVRPNAYRELKSDAGQRVVPLIGTLSPLERRVIDEWITYIDANFAEDHEVALTGTRDDARRMVETEALRRRLRDALHAASGDASVRLHHLRHAFAMRLQLVMTVEHLPTDRRFEQALLRILGPTDLEATRELLLDSRVLSHRGLSAARVLVGHASVGVYRRSYAHLDDLVSAAWLQPVFDARCFEVGDQLLSYLLAKPLKQPTKKAARSCLSLSLLEGFCDPPLATPDAMVCARRGPIVLPAREPQVEVPLRLRDIDRVLDIVHRRRGIDGLGALTMWPATQLSRLLATEHAVREASRYDIEASGWPATTATDSVSHVRAGRRMLHETRRVTPLLAQMEAYLESNEFVRRSQSTCDLWRRYYRPDATPWVLPTLENVATAASWCLAIGVKHNQIAVRVPPDVDASISEEARSTCGLLGIARQPCAEKVLPRVRRASSAAASSSPVRFGFVILENDRGPVMRMTHLNRAMHVLTTWLSLRAGPAPITTQPKEAKS